MLVFEVSCRCTVKFHASTVGTTSLSGLIWGDTVPVGPKKGRMPLLGITGNAADPEMGPQIAGLYGADRHAPVKLYAGARLSWFGEVSVWWASTGRFCVTVWPNSDPKTPMS